MIKDNTDRNRTSPFAFTGNKFEFRAVGASANNAVPMSTLNTIVAGQLIATKKEIDSALKKGKTLQGSRDRRPASEYYAESKAVCFEGNNYSAEWVVEAKKRGLPNEKTTPAALRRASPLRSPFIVRQGSAFSPRKRRCRATTSSWRSTPRTSTSRPSSSLR